LFISKIYSDKKNKNFEQSSTNINIEFQKRFSLLITKSLMNEKNFLHKYLFTLAVWISESVFHHALSGQPAE